MCPIAISERHLLASAGYDRKIRIWDPVAAVEVSQLDASSDLITAIYVITIAGNDQLVSIHRGSIRVWDPRTQTGIEQIPAGELVASCLAELNGQDLLISANRETIQIWNPVTWQHADTPAAQPASITAMTSLTVQSRPLLVTGEFGGLIRTWDMAPVAPQAAFAVHRGKVTALCPVTVNDQTLVATAGTDRTVRIWDVLTATCVMSIPVHHEALALAWLGNALAVGLTAGVIVIDLNAAVGAPGSAVGGAKAHAPPVGQ